MLVVKLDEPNPECLLVDDIIESGQTLKSYEGKYKEFMAMYAKYPKNPGDPWNNLLAYEVTNYWIEFPWESQATEESMATRILQFFGKEQSLGNIKSVINFLKNSI